MTEAEAIQIAKQVVEQNGWAWLEPVGAVYGAPKRRFFGLIRTGPPRATWIVRTNCHAKGCNATVSIDEATREVISQSYAPR